MVADTLVVIGLAVASLGTVPELGGQQQRSFTLRNDGTAAVTLVQGYTSCECTKIDMQLGATLAPGDTASVTLRFDPRGRGGDFTSTGTVTYSGASGARKRVKLGLQCKVAMSEQTLLRRFPVDAGGGLRLSTDRFDLGVMRRGETRERNVVVLHRDEGDRTEQVTVSYTPDAATPAGLQHVAMPVTVKDAAGHRRQLTITLDVLVK